jgi:hypothetical protein
MSEGRREPVLYSTLPNTFRRESDVLRIFATTENNSPLDHLILSGIELGWPLTRGLRQLPNASADCRRVALRRRRL